MLNSELVKKAHEMAKEIKAQYPDVDYRFQYGLCLSYLLNEKGDVEMEDSRITQLKELAAERKNYNRVWNRVEELSKKIRNRKFNDEEIKNFARKSENIISLAIEILKEEVKEEKKATKTNTTSKKDNAVYARYEGYDAEGMRINVGDEIKYVNGLGWIKAENY